MLVEFAYAVLIDHVLHHCQLSALVPTHFSSALVLEVFFLLHFFYYYLFKVFCQICTTYCMYVYTYLYIHSPATLLGTPVQLLGNTNC